MSLNFTPRPPLKILIAPDSFKGSLTALAAAQALAEGVRRVLPDSELCLFPMADGGEGTLECLLAERTGERRLLQVTGADGNPLLAEYGVVMIEGEAVAVIETARVVGLTLPGMVDCSVTQRNTLGVGEMLRHCLDAGIRRFMIGLGGSATNDGGAGMLAALGARFLDDHANFLSPTPVGLPRLARVDFSGLDPRLAHAEIVALSDVDNPLCGQEGATAVYGVQKGVAAAQVAEIDATLFRMAALCDAWCGKAVSVLPGSGAAGGLGYALQLVGAKCQSGAEAMLDLYRFDAALKDSDWVITGEGSSDAQTLHGKAPCAVAYRARKAGIPATLISGQVDQGAATALRGLFGSCFSIVQEGIDVQRAMRYAAHLLAECAEQAALLRVQLTP
jgi:glycerate kinase